MRASIIVIFIGVALTIFIYTHTTPTGYFFLPSEDKFQNLTFYYKCKLEMYDEPIFLEFLKMRIKQYNFKPMCDEICRRIDIYQINYTGELRKDDYDNLVCLCVPESKVVFKCKQNLSDELNLADVLQYVIAMN